MLGRLVLGRRDVGAGAVESAGVPEVDPCGGRELDFVDRPPGTVAVDQLGLVQPVDHRACGVGRRRKGVITYRFEDTIERSADEVWAYAADITRHPEWMGVLDAQVIRGLSTDVGAMGRETVRFGPWRFAAEFVVSASEPGRLIAWRVAGGGAV